MCSAQHMRAQAGRAAPLAPGSSPWRDLLHTMVASEDAHSIAPNAARFVLDSIGLWGKCSRRFAGWSCVLYSLYLVQLRANLYSVGAGWRQVALSSFVNNWLRSSADVYQLEKGVHVDTMTRLATAADGLLFSSEADYPLEPFVWTDAAPF